jgi:Bacterial regulatory proteins, tetR family
MNASIIQNSSAAGAIFAEAGYDNTTPNMIAAYAGISTGSLYQFFRDKEANAQVLPQISLQNSTGSTTPSFHPK